MRRGLVADSHSILARWRNRISQILNAYWVNDVGQTEKHTALLQPEPRTFRIELAIEKLKCHKAPGIDKIPPELIMAGGKAIRYDIPKLIFYIWNKEELPEEWKESIIVPISER
jgi:mannosyltransferase OCH1-like enzyme